MIGLPIRAPLPMAFVPPVVAVPAANAIVPLVLPSAIGGAAAATATVAGAPVVASLAAGFGLGLLLAAGLSQLWGQSNGPTRSTAAEPAEYGPSGTFTIAGYQAGEAYGTPSLVGPIQSNDGFAGAAVVIDKAIPTSLRWLHQETVVFTVNGVVTPVPVARGWAVDYLDNNGARLTYEVDARPNGFWALQSLPSVLNAYGLKVSCSSSCGQLVDVEGLLFTPNEWTNPRPLVPALLPASPWAPYPLPLPAPATVPDQQPETEPQTAPIEPGPSRPAVPGLLPARPPVVAPWLLPGSPLTPQQTTPDGKLRPIPAPPVPATEPGTVIPWPGAAPIPATGPTPRPDLQGIAQEVGKIERKLEIMMNPNAPGNLIDRFGDLADLVGPLIEALFSITAGTTYGLDSPCEVDEEGNKLPPVLVQAPGALNGIGVLINRIDAIAQLLQVHKNLKQPSCKNAPPIGEVVTVNFEQIE